MLGKYYTYFHEYSDGKVIMNYCSGLSVWVHTSGISSLCGSVQRYLPSLAPGHSVTSFVIPATKNPRPLLSGCGSRGVGATLVENHRARVIGEAFLRGSSASDKPWRMSGFPKLEKLGHSMWKRKHLNVDSEVVCPCWKIETKLDR